MKTVRSRADALPDSLAQLAKERETESLQLEEKLLGTMAHSLQCSRGS